MQLNPSEISELLKSRIQGLGVDVLAQLLTQVAEGRTSDAGQ